MIEHEDRKFDDMPIRPFAFTRRIMQRWKSNEQEISIVHGTPTGIGKSGYVNHVAADTMGYFLEKDWERLKWVWDRPRDRPVGTPIWEANYEAAKKTIQYKPEEMMDFLMDLLDRETKCPMVHWDDGGTWLNTMAYNDPFVISFMKFLPLARSVTAMLVLSTPIEEWVLKKLQTAQGLIHAPIIKLNNDTFFWKPRRCASYVKRRYPGRSRLYVNYMWSDDFPAIMPDSFFKWYKPRRDHYTRLAVAEMRVSLEKKKMRGIELSAEEMIIREKLASINDEEALELKKAEEPVQVANEKAKEFGEVVAQVVDRV